MNTSEDDEYFWCRNRYKVWASSVLLFFSGKSSISAVGYMILQVVSTQIFLSIILNERNGKQSVLEKAISSLFQLFCLHADQGGVLLGTSTCQQVDSSQSAAS
jgi:hypothetical protein